MIVLARGSNSRPVNLASSIPQHRKDRDHLATMRTDQSISSAPAHRPPSPQPRPNPPKNRELTSPRSSTQSPHVIPTPFRVACLTFPGEHCKVLPVSLSPMNLRLFIDFLIFSPNWNDHSGGAPCDWSRLHLVLTQQAQSLLALAGLGTIAKVSRASFELNSVTQKLLR